MRTGGFDQIPSCERVGTEVLAHDEIGVPGWMEPIEPLFEQGVEGRLADAHGGIRPDHVETNRGIDRVRADDDDVVESVPKGIGPAQFPCAFVDLDRVHRARWVRSRQPERDRAGTGSEIAQMTSRGGGREVATDLGVEEHGRSPVQTPTREDPRGSLDPDAPPGAVDLVVVPDVGTRGCLAEVVLVRHPDRR